MVFLLLLRRLKWRDKEARMLVRRLDSAGKKINTSTPPPCPSNISTSVTRESVSEFGEYFFRVLAFASMSYIFTEHIAYVTLVMGPSMLNTFDVVGDLLIVEAVTPILFGYNVGDGVVAKSPTKPAP